MKPDEKRFWKLVKKTKKCWIWMGNINPWGYGRFWFNKKNHFAHHFLLWEKKPIGKLFLHRCDNPACVRPSHIFFGTQKENFRDMISKGRSNQRPGWIAMMKIRCGKNWKPAHGVVEPVTPFHSAKPPQRTAKA